MARVERLEQRRPCRRETFFAFPPVKLTSAIAEKREEVSRGFLPLSSPFLVFLLAALPSAT
jgi:hypothetical protein